MFEGGGKGDGRGFPRASSHFSKEKIERAPEKWSLNGVKFSPLLLLSFLIAFGSVSCVKETYPGSTSSGFQNAEAIRAVEER